MAEPSNILITAFAGTAGAVATISLARSSPRLAAGALMLTYLGGWAALLLWNAAEGARLARSGVTVTG